MATTTTTKTQRVLEALQNGSQLTARQIQARYRTSNAYDIVFRLRNQGHNIVLVDRTNSKGETRNFYTYAA